MSRVLSLRFDTRPADATITVTAGTHVWHPRSGQTLLLTLEDGSIHLDVREQGYTPWQQDVLTTQMQNVYQVTLDRSGSPLPWLLLLLFLPVLLLALRAWRRRPPPPDEVESLDPFLGHSLAGYRLDSVLGRGGMGVVYRGVKGPRVVAVKVCDVAAGARIIERFKSEMLLCEKIKHPNVVAVQNWGLEPVPHLVMELVDGTTLRQRMKAGLSRAETLSILQQIAAGLSCAHAMGITHRDVKPENVLMDRDGHARIADFGLARAHDDPRFTTTGRIAGSPGYLSPEVADQEAGTPASDQYSLGVIAWEMLAGGSAFTAQDTMALLYQQLWQGLPDLHQQCPDVPQQAADVVKQMTASDPEDRFPDVQTAIEALTHALEQ
ncbi:MAG: serine/threonine-protein kinase [Candidatus Xenobia bacterium]